MTYYFNVSYNLSKMSGFHFKTLLRKQTLIASFLLFFTTLLVYTLSHRQKEYANYFIFLADAFLNGRLHLLIHPSWLNELINWHGNYYVVYPPMPAILLMPFVAIFGVDFPQPMLSIILASGNVALSYLVFIRIFNNKKVAYLMSILYAFGTIQWFHAEVGSAWYVAHIAAMFFLWLAILETITKGRLFLVGLLVGFAYLSRLPTILAIVFPLTYLYEKFLTFGNRKLKAVNFKNLIFLGLGLGIPVIFNFAYNYVRYGVINDISYQLLPVFSEPWYRYGLFNIRYIPTHLKEMLTALPKFSIKPPFIIPSMYVMAIWFTTPAFILAFFAEYKTRIALASLISLIFIAIPELSHGAPGFTQFGYRYLMDFYPFLLILTASGIMGRVKLLPILLIILSILVNLWGVIMISFLNIWTW